MAKCGHPTARQPQERIAQKGHRAAYRDVVETHARPSRKPGGGSSGHAAKRRGRRRGRRAPRDDEQVVVPDAGLVELRQPSRSVARGATSQSSQPATHRLLRLERPAVEQERLERGRDPKLRGMTDGTESARASPRGALALLTCCSSCAPTDATRSCGSAVTWTTRSPSADVTVSCIFSSVLLLSFSWLKRISHRS